MKYLLPLTNNEFLLWYRRSELKIMKFRLIPTFDVDFTDNVSELDKIAARVVKAMPDYDEDYEVLIAKVEDNSSWAPYNFEKNQPTFINISIHNLDCVYPITERGKRLLIGRVDSNINVGEPIFESYVHTSVQQRQSSLSLLGGTALLKIAGLDIYKYKNTINQIKDDALSGASRNSSGEEFPFDGALIENLLCYTRHEVMPNTDIAYFYDFGKILSKLYPSNDNITDLLDKYRSCLKEITNKNATLEDLLEKVDDVMSLFDAALDAKLGAVSIIIFLKLQSELYQHQNLYKTSFKELVDSLGQKRTRDIVIALWLVGVCFGFDFFCATYYEAIQPKFFIEF